MLQVCCSSVGKHYDISLGLIKESRGPSATHLLEIFRECCSTTSSPLPTTLPENQGVHVCSFPITGTPYLGNRLYPYLEYWLSLAITKTPPFPGFLGRASRDYGPKYPPFPRKWEHPCGPPYAFEWVGGTSSQGPGSFILFRCDATDIGLLKWINKGIALHTKSYEGRKSPLLPPLPWPCCHRVPR